MSYFGVSLRNGVGLGLGTVPSLTNPPLSYRLAPSLDLSFAGSDALSPAITFSRTTNATLTNSAGLVANAPMNLLTFSEQFDNAAWTKTNATVAANTTEAPNGTLTADTMTATAANGTLRNDPAKSGEITNSIYVKRKTGTGGVQLLDATGTYRTITVTSEWTRVSYTATAASASLCGIRLSVSGDEIYVWGAQSENSSTATTYNPTTVKNLLGFTENFDNAAWTKSNASISATKVDDIYGQPFAQQVTSSASNGTVLSTYTAVASTPYTFIIWMKRVTGTGNIDISADGTTWATQTLTSEWQRFSVTVSPTAGSKTPGVRIATSGDSIYIFGAQLSDSASVDPYVYQPVAAPSSVAYYGPRFDYDPVTLAPKGLLIEEQRSNLLLNSATLSTQVVTVAATAHTLSFYGTGTIVLSGASTGTVVGTGAYPARATLTFTPTVGVLTLTVTGSVTMAQLEAGAFATSYIPTVASQVTRAADSASMIGNNFARWYNQTEGTVYGEATALANFTSASVVAEIGDGTLNNRFNISRVGSLNQAVANTVVGGAVQASISTFPAFVPTVSSKTSSAIKVDDFAASSNGGAAVTDTSGSIPNVNQMALGATTTGIARWNGTLARIAYYNRRLSNTELQGITA